MIGVNEHQQKFVPPQLSVVNICLSYQFCCFLCAFEWSRSSYSCLFGELHEIISCYQNAVRRIASVASAVQAVVCKLILVAVICKKPLSDIAVQCQTEAYLLFLKTIGTFVNFVTRNVLILKGYLW